MDRKSKSKILSLIIVSGMLLGGPNVHSEAAVITSNATDKTAVVFDENTAYSAGDYVTYDGEMYICTGDIQGSWNSAKEHFMQLTKNHELGNSDDLSTAYDASADPSEEKSLMAFVANAWQKLKVFLGTDNRAAQTDVSNYKNASVSAKLNLLEEQNEDMDEHVGNLQEWVENSFGSVSSGKSILASTITDKGVDVRQDAKFPEINAAILDMAQLQYDNGHETGMKDADNRVNKDSKSYLEGVKDADGRVNKDSQSYLEGVKDADGRVNKDSQSYLEGVKDADGRVNKDSQSYLEGINDGAVNARPKVFSLSTRLTFGGVSAGSDYFNYTMGDYGRKTWKLDLPIDGTIVGVYVNESTITAYTTGTSTQMALDIGGTYKVVISKSDIGTKGDKIVVTSDSVTWDGFEFSPSGSGTDYSEISIYILYM